MNRFRTLRADEIDCRIAQIKKDGSGLSLLLYKDARCDQNILDETVGEMNWERKHSRDNANCTVSIWDEQKKMWISKEDTGTESNTEKEKGLASDSFKRACFNWGIGRELYTAPFIWIKKEDCSKIEVKGDRAYCYDRFSVAGIGYTDGVITGLQIKNEKTGRICFRYGEVKYKAPDKPKQQEDEPEDFPKQLNSREEVNATVGTVSKVPEPEKKQKNPVKEYIGNELVFMGQMFGITNKKEMLDRFMEMRQTLIDEKVIEDIPSDNQTKEQAEKMIDEMYKRFKPSGDAA